MYKIESYLILKIKLNAIIYFRYVTTEQKKQEGAKRDNEVLLHRQRNGVSVPYRVVDNPAKLSASDWDRVVGVFVMGPAWQFKGYPWENPVEIFAKGKLSLYRTSQVTSSKLIH